MESESKELEKTFDDDTMKISIEDVDSEVADNTSGPGLGAARDSGSTYSRDEDGAEVEEGIDIDSEEEMPLREGSVLGDADELEAVARELEEADRMDSTDSAEKDSNDEVQSPDEEEREGMDNFRRWLKRMQDPGGDKK
jgi:hypothetical protein